jgi:hypothetical protein
MGTWSKIILSGSTDGQGYLVTGLTPSTGSLIHTAVTGAAESVDEVIIYAHNTATTASEISLAIGPTTATGSRYTQTITGGDLGGLHPICPGLIIRNETTVKAYVTAVNRVALFGWVNRYAS